MASSSTSSPTVPASSSQTWKYDVFLSFRGEDTRKNFVDHLYSELESRLIHTYKDDKTLPRGDLIGPSLMWAIEESRIAVIIFSKNYADSSWCLDELTHIMKCRDQRGQIVMPIFYDVDPSEVRKQKGDFGKAFDEQKKKNITKVESWIKALVDASNIAGWEPKNIANGHESEGIKEIVDEILDKLFSLNPDVDTDLVGMGTRLQSLKLQLGIGSGGVRMVGIWGVGGGGKTTLASCLYNEMSHRFGGHCFVDNIREESIKYGLKHLQEKILSTLLKTKVGVESVYDGKHKIKQRLSRSKVLLVLDDVDHVDQLEALAGKHDWFGDGSRVIITTRDENLLNSHKVDEVSHVSLLSREEAIELFHRFAYRENKPVEDYEKLSLRVLSYADGLPLAIRVLGKFLYDKNKIEWMSTLDRLKDNPEMKIVEKLKISYDGLGALEKELFLDIACFYRWVRVDKTMEILDACGFHPRVGITVLRQKALITISKDGCFDMHDLVQEMGHYIVQGEHPHDNPEEHSRLWQNDVINDLCSGDVTKPNYKVKAIRYDGDSSRFLELVSNMKKLKFLQVYAGRSLLEGPKFLSNDLQYLEWQFYCGNSFPENFHPTKLAGLNVGWSLQKELWNGYQSLPRLKKLRLYHLDNLLSTPNISGLPCLEELSVKECSSLKEIHPSTGNHTNLVEVYVYECGKLRMFPDIIHMEKLETLVIERCHVLHNFPKIQTNMDRLVELTLHNVGIYVFPSSIGDHCTSLTSLRLMGCEHLESIEGNFHALKCLKELDFYGLPKLKNLPQISLFDEKCCLEKLRSSIRGLCFYNFHHMRHSLRMLNLSHSQLKDGDIPSDIGELSNLQKLDLSGNDFSRLHFSLSQLTRLRFLNLSYCCHLVELPDLPSNIAILIAFYCESLASIGDRLTNCKWLNQVILWRCRVNGANKILGSMLQGYGVENHSFSLQVDGIEIPKRFIPLVYGHRYILQLQPSWCKDYGFLMCASLKSTFFYEPLEITMEHGIGLGITGYHKDIFYDNDVGTWVGYVSFASLRRTIWWESISDTVSFSISNPFVDYICAGFVVGVVHKNTRSGMTEETTQVRTISSEYGDDDYSHKIKITHDSMSTLKIKFPGYD